MTTSVFTAEEAAALAQVDEEAIARTLLELIAIPSVTGSAAETEIQHDLAGRLDQLGLDRVSVSETIEVARTLVLAVLRTVGTK